MAARGNCYIIWSDVCDLMPADGISEADLDVPAINVELLTNGEGGFLSARPTWSQSWYSPVFLEHPGSPHLQIPAGLPSFPLMNSSSSTTVTSLTRPLPAMTCYVTVNSAMLPGVGRERSNEVITIVHCFCRHGLSTTIDSNNKINGGQGRS